MHVRPIDLAYAAGFFDGEGYVGFPKRTRLWRGLRASVAQVDRRPLQKFFDAVQIGTIRGPYARPGRKSYYQWMADGNDVEVLYERLRPYLALKGDQFEGALQQMRDYRSLAYGEKQVA